MAQFDPNKYDTVADRIKQFRAAHPQGAIIVTLLSDPAQFDQVVCRAEIYEHRDDAKPIGADIAAEWRGENYKAGANFTAWHENAATSAIGRALDAAGYSKVKEPGARATLDEMRKAERVTATPLTVPSAVPVAIPVTYENTWEGFTSKAADFGFVRAAADEYRPLAEYLNGQTFKRWGEVVYGMAIGEPDSKWRDAVAHCNATPEVLVEDEPGSTLEAMVQ